MSNINGVGGAANTAGGLGGGEQKSGTPEAGDMRSWYEAMARAWGSALDNQAARVTSLSQSIGEGGQDNPSTITLLSAESMRMQFLANNAHTATASVGQALDALARK